MAPIPKKCTVAPLGIFFLTALAEKREKEEFIKRISGFWAGRCFQTEIGHGIIVFLQLKGCLRKWREERTCPNSRKKSLLLRVIFEICNSNIC